MSDKELWSTIKTKLAADQTVNQEIYNTYLANARFVAAPQNAFFLVIQSTFGVRLVEPLLKQISTLIKEETQVTPNLKALSTDRWEKEEANLLKVTISEVQTKKTSLASKNYEFSFKHFVSGPSNFQAFKAAQATVQSPGKWNPLFIYGPSGLGKTHLLNAIAYEFRSLYPHLKVLYISSDDFARQVVGNLQKGHFEIEQFKSEINAYDILLIDDVQFLAKKDKTNEVLFTVFNHFAENGKQLIFSSDKLPDQLNGFDMRLITRFNQGLAIPIQSLDFNTAKAITKIEFARQDLTNRVKDEVIEYIAQFFANDVRKIKGSVTKINFWIMTNALEGPLDLRMLQDLFKDMPTSNLGELNTKRIKEVVADKYGIAVKLLDGKARVSNVATARHVSMYLTKEILGHSLSQIGAEFGGRDHTTVMSGIKKIKKNMEASAEFRKNVEAIRNKIVS
ncbi:chromosomal replication initiator protein DnaA [Entomoplasma freundtii]|nr:chromosomal replication initiator protein DnaA [Entomoplasma freundtii]